MYSGCKLVDSAKTSTFNTWKHWVNYNHKKKKGGKFPGDRGWGTENES